jgi:hypothetical protein
MDPVDMVGTNVTVTLSAPYITVYAGCQIRFQFVDGDEAELLLGELPNHAVELRIEVEALRKLVRRGTEALHLMDALRAQGDEDRG